MFCVPLAVDRIVPLTVDPTCRSIVVDPAPLSRIEPIPPVISPPDWLVMRVAAEVLTTTPYP